MGTKTQREKRRRRARGHGATIKIERKKNAHSSCLAKRNGYGCYACAG